MNASADTPEPRQQVRNALWLSALLAGFGLLLSVMFWGRVPDPMPIHWNEHGQPDGFGSRTFGLLLMPALTLGLPVLIAALTKIDPRRAHTSRSSNALGMILGGMAAFMFAMHGAIIKAAISETMTLDAGFVILLVGALFVIVGNALPKFGSNYFMGVRTPWTLQSEKVWIKTHQLAGKLFVAGGLLIVLTGLLLPVKLLFPIMLGLTLVVSLTPVVYSWWVYKPTA